MEKVRNTLWRNLIKVLVLGADDYLTGQHACIFPKEGRSLVKESFVAAGSVVTVESLLDLIELHKIIKKIKKQVKI